MERGGKMILNMERYIVWIIFFVIGLVLFFAYAMHSLGIININLLRVEGLIS
jgi:uncharacterized membrane protein YecN with MAPEG domain